MSKGQQSDLFNPAEEPQYAFDASSFLNFLDQSDDEPYGKDVMKTAWAHIEACLRSGKIICPEAIKDELKKREDKVPGLKEWLRASKDCFMPLDQLQIEQATPITRKYTIYGEPQGDYGDLMLLSFAKSRGLTIVTSEVRKDQHSKFRPKIPNVADEFDIECVSVIGFLRKEKLEL